MAEKHWKFWLALLSGAGVTIVVGAAGTYAVYLSMSTPTAALLYLSVALAVVGIVAIAVGVIIALRDVARAKKEQADQRRQELIRRCEESQSETEASIDRLNAEIAASEARIVEEERKRVLDEKEKAADNRRRRAGLIELWAIGNSYTLIDVVDPSGSNKELKKLREAWGTRVGRLIDHDEFDRFKVADGDYEALLRILWEIIGELDAECGSGTSEDAKEAIEAKEPTPAAHTTTPFAMELAQIQATDLAVGIAYAGAPKETQARVRGAAARTLEASRPNNIKARELEVVVEHGEDLREALGPWPEPALQAACKAWFADAVNRLPVVERSGFREIVIFPDSPRYTSEVRTIDLDPALRFLARVIKELRAQ
jgi:hypothetical protein